MSARLALVICGCAFALAGCLGEDAQPHGASWQPPPLRHSSTRKLMDYKDGKYVNSDGDCRPTSADYDRRWNYSCKDENWKKIYGVSRQYCEDQCSCRQECVAYTFNTATSNCYLKKTCVNTQSSAVDMSGLRKVGAYTYYDSWVCKDYSFLSVRSNTRSDCNNLCNSRAECGAFTFDDVYKNCDLKYGCLERTWVSGRFTGVKNKPAGPYQPPTSGGSLFPPIVKPTPVSPPTYPSGNPPYVPPVNPPVNPPANPPANPQQSQPGCYGNLPFGLEQCVCDGAQAGEAVGLAACSRLATMCAPFLPFSVDDGMLQAVQRVCDTLSHDSCVGAAQALAASQPGCVDILQGGTPKCSRDKARQIFQGEVDRMCGPLCPDCPRMKQ